MVASSEPGCLTHKLSHGSCLPAFRGQHFLLLRHIASTNARIDATPTGPAAEWRLRSLPHHLPSCPCPASLPSLATKSDSESRQCSLPSLPPPSSLLISCAARARFVVTSSAERLAKLTPYFEGLQLRVIVDPQSPFAFSEVPAAFAHLESGHATGKIVIGPIS